MRLVSIASILARASLLTIACGTTWAADSSLEPVTDAAPAPASGYFVHVGPGVLSFYPRAKVYAAGAELPGAAVQIGRNTTLVTEFGYRWSNNFAISFTGGVPPLAKVNGAGSLDAVGELGAIRYGPAVVTAQYHFTQFGRFQPYVGAGPVFLHIFKNEDGAVRNLRVRNHSGFAVEVGAEYQLDSHWSLYFDAKKARLKTTATGMLGDAPIFADIKLDPALVTGGLSYRF